MFADKYREFRRLEREKCISFVFPLRPLRPLRWKWFWLRLRRGVFIIIGMDERDFYDEKDAKKSHTLNCPHCREANEYELSWLVRTQKKQLPGKADERDRAKFANARTHMVRRDRIVMCKNMRSRQLLVVTGGQS